MDVRRVLNCFLVACLVSCATLSGLDDKAADLEDGVGAPVRPGGELDGGSSSSSSGGPNADGSSGIDGDTPSQNDGSSTPDSGPTTSRIRDITFEDKKLVHPTSGFDSTLGTAQLTTTGPIGGAYSMLVGGLTVYGTVSFSAVDNLYVAVRFRVASASASNAADAHILRVTHSGGAPIEAVVKGSPRDFSVVQGAAVLGDFGTLATDGTIYRVDLAVRSTGNVSVKLTGGGATSSAGGAATLGASSKLEVGSVSGGAIQAMFDDISIDSAVPP
jgi:hypothetical protein